MHLPTDLLCSTAAMAPGSVNAPAWLLPSAAAMTGLIPLSLLAIVKPSEAQQSSMLVPGECDAWALKRRETLAVGSAGCNKGDGLFAVDTIPANTYLFDYDGELLSKAEYDRRYPSRVSDYAVGIKAPNELMFIDACDPSKSGLARFMNHDHRRPNVGRRTVLPLENSLEPPRVLMYTKCAIEAGEELCWDCAFATRIERQRVCESCLRCGSSHSSPFCDPQMARVTGTRTRACSRNEDEAERGCIERHLLRARRCSTVSAALGGRTVTCM